MRESTPTAKKNPEPLTGSEKIRTLIQQIFAHPVRVTVLGMIFAIENNLVEKKDLPRFLTDLVFHDVGKSKIKNPLQIILKNGKLNLVEKKRMDFHPAAGGEIFKGIGLDKVNHDIAGHHEFWNGLGYPNGLKGEEIPRLARIIKVVDYFDATTAWRGYNNIDSPETASRKIQKLAGTEFDPGLVEPFCKFIEKHRLLVRFLLLNSPRAKPERNLGEPEPCPS